MRDPIGHLRLNNFFTQVFDRRSDIAVCMTLYALSPWRTDFIQNAPHGVIGTAHRKGIERDVVGWGIRDHFRRHDHLQSSVCIERIPALRGPNQYRSIGIDEFHFATIDLRPTIERTAAHARDFSLDKAAFRLAHSQADKVAIDEANLKAFATSSD